jgi:hypothetical protein
VNHLGSPQLKFGGMIDGFNMVGCGWLVIDPCAALLSQPYTLIRQATEQHEQEPGKNRQQRSIKSSQES